MSPDENSVQALKSNIPESTCDNALPCDGEYILCKDEVYLISSIGNFQLLPEVAPSLGYKLIPTTLSSSIINKGGKSIDETSAMLFLVKPEPIMGRKEQPTQKDIIDRKVAVDNMLSAIQKLRFAAENEQVKTANPQRLEVHWEKKQ